MRRELIVALGREPSGRCSRLKYRTACAVTLRWEGDVAERNAKKKRGGDLYALITPVPTSFPLAKLPRSLSENLP